MEPLNDYLQVKPIKTGVISSSESNEYIIIMPFSLGPYFKDDTVIIESDLVVRVVVGGEECYFVKTESILAVIHGPTDDPDNSTQTGI